jgi:hypothetical protein
MHFQEARPIVERARVSYIDEDFEFKKEDGELQVFPGGGVIVDKGEDGFEAMSAEDFKANYKIKNHGNN